MMFVSMEDLGFWAFLASLNNNAARSAGEMDDLIFSHPSSAIVKAGIVVEEIISDVFKIENINEETFTSLASKIFYLYQNGYIKRYIYDSFTTIRKNRNKAAHNSSSHSLTAASLCHEKLYEIVSWYIETYGEPNIRIPDYEIPKQKHLNISEIVTGTLRKELSKVIEGVTNSKLGITKQSKSQATLEKPQIINSDELIGPQTADDDTNRDDNGPTLLDELSRLRDSSNEAIENADHFSDYKKYLHVNRQIQLDLEGILKDNQKNKSSNLILLCGSVGDGKSHLLAYLNNERPNLIKDYKIYNDATESNSPTMDAMESLEENLKHFSDQLIGITNQKSILAINMGVLHNFINRDHEKYSYKKLKEFVDNSKLFTDKITTTHTQEHFNLISFGDYHYYELTEDGPTSSFYEELLNKIVDRSLENPFYSAFLRDRKNGQYTIVHQNFKILQNEIVRRQIIQLIISAIVKHKLVISARAFLNFIADIVIPGSADDYQIDNDVYQLKHSLPNLLFNRSERSEILKYIKGFDPIHMRLKEVDDIYIKINTYEHLMQLAKDYNLDDSTKEILLPFLNNIDKSNSIFSVGIKTFIRTLLLTHNEFSEKLLESTVKDYLLYVYAFNVGRRQAIREMYEMVKSCINLWQGHINEEYTFIGKSPSEYKIAQKLNLSYGP